MFVSTLNGRPDCEPCRIFQFQGRACGQTFTSVGESLKDTLHDFRSKLEDAGLRLCTSHGSFIIRKGMKAVGRVSGCEVEL